MPAGIVPRTAATLSKRVSWPWILVRGPAFCLRRPIALTLPAARFCPILPGRAGSSALPPARKASAVHSRPRNGPCDHLVEFEESADRDPRGPGPDRDGHPFGAEPERR